MTGELVEAEAPPAGRDAFPYRRGDERTGSLPVWLVMSAPTLENFGQRINTPLLGGKAEANCRYCIDYRKRRVTVKTTRVVGKGDELLGWYGAEYVRNLRPHVEAQMEENAREEEAAKQQTLADQSRDAGGRFASDPWRRCEFCPAIELGDKALKRHLNICKARRLRKGRHNTRRR